MSWKQRIEERLTRLECGVAVPLQCQSCLEYFKPWKADNIHWETKISGVTVKFKIFCRTIDMDNARLCVPCTSKVIATKGTMELIKS